MKKILVLTDFSDTAQQAARAAVNVAGKTHANIILLNTFVSQPALSEYGASPWVAEQLLWEDEGKEKLDFLKEQLERFVQHLPPGDHHPSIHSQQEVGRLSGQVKELLQKETVEMIVMGSRSGNAWEHLLMGSDTNGVINHSNRPVLIIPASHTLNNLKKVTFATDFDSADIKAVRYLTHLGRLFNFSLEIVHVRLWGKEAMPAEQSVDFKKHVAKFNFPNISYQDIGGKELIKRLNHLCSANGSDMLVLVHDQHSLLNQLFKKNNTQTLIEQQKLPVMIIPASIAVN